MAQPRLDHLRGAAPSSSFTHHEQVVQEDSPPHIARDLLEYLSRAYPMPDIPPVMDLGDSIQQADRLARWAGQQVLIAHLEQLYNAQQG